MRKKGNENVCVLQVKRGSEDNVALDADNARGKLALQLGVSNALGGGGHLSQQLLKTSESANDRTLKGISHLANLGEASAL